MIIIIGASTTTATDRPTDQQWSGTQAGKSLDLACSIPITTAQLGYPVASRLRAIVSHSTLSPCLSFAWARQWWAGRWWLRWPVKPQGPIVTGRPQACTGHNQLITSEQSNGRTSYLTRRSTLVNKYSEQWKRTNERMAASDQTNKRTDERTQPKVGAIMMMTSHCPCTAIMIRPHKWSMKLKTLLILQ